MHSRNKILIHLRILNKGYTNCTPTHINIPNTEFLRSQNVPLVMHFMTTYSLHFNAPRHLQVESNNGAIPFKQAYARALDQFKTRLS